MPWDGNDILFAVYTDRGDARHLIRRGWLTGRNVDDSNHPPNMENIWVSGRCCTLARLKVGYM